MGEVMHVAARLAKTTGRSKAPLGGQRQTAALAPAPRGMPAAILGLQRAVGNRLVQRLFSGPAPSPAAGGLRLLVAPALPVLVNGDGKSDVSAVGDTLVERTTQAPHPQEQFNEAGLLDGELTSDVVPEVFVDGGKTGTAVVNWAGGGGGAGNQGVGTITLVAPVIESRDPPTAGGPAIAWVRPGTGTATVTRSYTGVLVGANGPNFFFTASAAARADRHERLHVASSLRNHDAHIKPLETRIARRTGPGSALTVPSTSHFPRITAVADLETELDWNASIARFQAADTADNTPGGTVDTTDMAAADFIRDLGPRVIGGVNFPHFIDTPPPPAPRPG